MERDQDTDAPRNADADADADIQSVNELLEHFKDATEVKSLTDDQLERRIRERAGE